MQPVILVLITLLLSGCYAHQPEPKLINQVPTGVRVEGVLVEGFTMEELNTALAELANERNSLPQNAMFDHQGNIIPEKPGRMLDITATAQKTMAAAPHSQLTAVYNTVNPEVTQYSLAQATIIGGYATEIIDNNPDRVKNISLTVILLNNTLLEPGQEFSFNRLTGEPTEARGFRPATILQDGQKTEGIGGGMCQVSSTIFNAVLAANLTVLERHPHSQPVNYVPEGRDATTFTDKDFRFVNSTRQKILLRVLLADDSVRADILVLPD